MSVGQSLLVDVHGLDDILASSAARLQPAVATVIHRNGLLLQGRVRAHASGRPGPRVQTGDYRRGIRLQTGVTIGVAGAAVPFATVYSTSPQGQRLENGFVGVDSLGRHYQQPAFPHFAPGLAEVAPIVERDLQETVDDLIRRVA